MRQGHQVKVKVKVSGAKQACLYILFMDGLPSFKMQSCFSIVLNMQQNKMYRVVTSGHFVC